MQNGKEGAVGGEEDGPERDWDVLAADEGGLRSNNDGSRGVDCSRCVGWAGIDGYDIARVVPLRLVEKEKNERKWKGRCISDGWHHEILGKRRCNIPMLYGTSCACCVDAAFGKTAGLVHDAIQLKSSSWISPPW